MRIRSIRFVAAIGLFAVASGCQPDSPTAARDQLGRNADGSISFILPVTDTTFLVSELLASDIDTVTTNSGLLGIVQSDTVSSSIGEELQFSGVGFSPFSFSYTQMLQTQEMSTSVSFPSPPPSPLGIPMAPGTPNDTFALTTPNGSDVTGATIDSGWVVRTMANNTICDGTLSVSLVDDMGSTIVTMPDVAVNAGQTIVDSADASGAAISGFVAVNTSGDFGVCTPNPTDSIQSDITFRPMTLASVDLQNVNETFAESYDLLATETRLNSIDTVTINSGSIAVTVSNRLPVQMEFDIVLNGFLDQSGNPLRDTVIVAAAAGDGTYTNGILNFDLANVTLIPALANAAANGSAVAPSATVTSAVVTDAVLVAGSGDIVVESLTGALDPAVTSELVLSVEEFEELDPDEFNFDDLEDAIQSSTLNSGTIELDVSNGADIPIVMSGFIVGVVELTPTGQIPRDAGGNPIYATGCSGSPTVAIVDPGQTTLTLPRSGTSNVVIDATSMVDCIVHKLIDDERVAMVASGIATAGDGTQATIRRQDAVSVAINVVVGLDFTIPVAGVTFTRNQTADGLDLDEDDADQLAERLISAGIVAEIENSTPFFVEVEVAIVADSVGDTVDIFALPNAILLNPVSLTAAPTDGAGVPIQSVTDSVTIAISGEDIRSVLGRIYTAGIRIRLGPRPDGGRRGAIRPEDGVGVDASVAIEVKRGNS